MKKWLFAFPVSLIAIGLQVQAMPVAAQTAQASGDASAQTAGQAGQPATRTVQATPLKVELTKQVGSKHAKVGDMVMARTTSTATLSDGMKLPRGTKLMGKVTEVQAKSHAHHTSQLAFAFNQAVLKKGQAIPIRAVVTSVSVPSAMAAENAAGGMAPDASGGMAAPPPASGGAVGGGGAVSAPGGTAGGGAMGSSVAENTATQTEAMANDSSNGSNRVGNSQGRIVNNGSSVSGPVAGLQGVTFSSSIHSNNSAQMNGENENISLASGTQMTMAVIAENASAAPSM